MRTAFVTKLTILSFILIFIFIPVANASNLFEGGTIIIDDIYDTLAPEDYPLYFRQGLLAIYDASPDAFIVNEDGTAKFKNEDEFYLCWAWQFTKSSWLEGKEGAYSALTESFIEVRDNAVYNPDSRANILLPVKEIPAGAKVVKEAEDTIVMGKSVHYDAVIEVEVPLPSKPLDIPEAVTTDILEKLQKWGHINKITKYIKQGRTFYKLDNGYYTNFLRNFNGSRDAVIAMQEAIDLLKGRPGWDKGLPDCIDRIMTSGSEGNGVMLANNKDFHEDRINGFYRGKNWAFRAAWPYISPSILAARKPVLEYNLAADYLEINPNPAAADEVIEVTTKVSSKTNDGSILNIPTKVRLSIDDAVIEEKDVNVPVNDSTQVIFNTTAPAEGNHKVSILVNPNQDMPAEETNIITGNWPGDNYIDKTLVVEAPCTDFSISFKTFPKGAFWQKGMDIPVIVYIKRANDGPVGAVKAKVTVQGPGLNKTFTVNLDQGQQDKKSWNIPAGDGGTYTYTATVTSIDIPDCSPGNNRASASFKVQETPETGSSDSGIHVGLIR